MCRISSRISLSIWYRIGYKRNLDPIGGFVLRECKRACRQNDEQHRGGPDHDCGFQKKPAIIELTPYQGTRFMMYLSSQRPTTIESSNAVETFSTSQLAERTNVSVETLRYYERRGQEPQHNNWCVTSWIVPFFWLIVRAQEQLILSTALRSSGRSVVYVAVAVMAC